MKRLLKKIRNIEFINLVLRVVIKKCSTLSNAFFLKAIKHMTIKGVVPITLSNGKTIKMFSNSDDFVLKELYFGISDEKGTEKILRIVTERSSIIFDVGANTGLFTMFCWGFNSGCRIYSFEPVDQIANRLERNISLNQPHHIHVVRKLVSDTVQSGVTLFVPNTEISYSASTYKDFHDPSTIHPKSVDAITLDSFKNERRVGKIDLIKIDVEWHELEVLKGAIEVLKTDHPILIIEILFPELEVEKNPQLKGKLPKEHHQNIQKLLADQGYYFYMLQPHGIYRVVNLEPNANERNYLFSKKKSERNFISFHEKDLLIQEVLG